MSEEIKKRCGFLRRHKWSLWSRPISTYEGGYKQQWRECELCGKAQFRTLGWDKLTSINDVRAALEEVAG